MPKASRNIAQPKPQGATRMGTQGTILQGVDMRTHGGRRFKELCADLVAHLCDDPTAPQFAIIRRAAALGKARNWTLPHTLPRQTHFAACFPILALSAAPST